MPITGYLALTLVNFPRYLFFFLARRPSFQLLALEVPGVVIFYEAGKWHRCLRDFRRVPFRGKHGSSFIIPKLFAIHLLDRVDIIPESRRIFR